MNHKSVGIEKKRDLIDPATFFFIAGLLVGILYCIAIPYGAGFDEERHLVRIYYMSEGEWLPNFTHATIHEDIADLSYQRRLIQTPAFDMFHRETFGRRFSTFDKIRYGQKTQSIYSPVIFLPQALIGRILWWRFDFPILPTIILQRIAGLLIYIAGGYLMIRTVPYGKWILTAVALLPAALFQATTLNADGFTAAASFAFIGWVLAVYINERTGIQPKSVWILSVLLLLLGCAKPGAIILLPLLLILLRHPFPAKKWIALLGAAVLLSVVVNVGWWKLASQGSVFSGEGGQSISQQSGTILAQPIGFLKLLLQGMFLTFGDELRGWIAGFGYGAGTVPAPVYFFAVLLLVSAFLAEPQLVRLPNQLRIFLIVFFVFCCTAIYTIAFIPNYVTGGVLALAKHGRYYIPFAPLFFLGLAGLFAVPEPIQRLAKLTAIASFLFVIGYYSFGIYTTYYTYCGYEAYAGGTCTLPIYKNLEKEDIPTVSIGAEVLVSQTFTNWCGALETVEVFIKSTPQSSAGGLRFSLLDNHQQVLARQDFPTNQVVAGNYLKLTVKLPAGMDSKDFEIQLASSSLPAPEGIQVGLTRTNYYPGVLSVNGVINKHNDLLIHYTCTGP